MFIWHNLRVLSIHLGLLMFANFRNLFMVWRKALVLSSPNWALACFNVVLWFTFWFVYVCFPYSSCNVDCSCVCRQYHCDWEWPFNDSKPHPFFEQELCSQGSWWPLLFSWDSGNSFCWFISLVLTKSISKTYYYAWTWLIVNLPLLPWLPRQFYLFMLGSHYLILLPTIKLLAHFSISLSQGLISALLLTRYLNLCMLLQLHIAGR